MAEVKQIVTDLEDAVRTLDNLADVLFYMTTIDERRSTLADTLALIQNKILTLNDGLLYSLY